MSGEGRCSGRIVVTRPANTTAYSANDAIGDTNGSAIKEIVGMGMPGQPFMLMSATLEYDVSALPVGFTATLELYSASPTAIADNAAWSLVAGDRALHLGSINFGAPAVRVATLKAELDIINKVFAMGRTRSLFGILTTPAGFVPAGNSEVLAYTLCGMTL